MTKHINNQDKAQHNTRQNIKQSTKIKQLKTKQNYSRCKTKSRCKTQNKTIKKSSQDTTNKTNKEKFLKLRTMDKSIRRPDLYTYRECNNTTL